MSIFQRIWWFLCAIFYPKYLIDLKEKYKTALFQQMLPLCQSDMDKLTCQEFFKQMAVFDNCVVQKNITGCIFSMNVMLGLHERIQENDQLGRCIGQLCSQYIQNLRSLGVKVIYA